LHTARTELHPTFRKRVACDSRITKYLNAAAIARAFDITRQLHAVDSIFSRVFTA
jgi:hypothetical protein